MRLHPHHRQPEVDSSRHQLVASAQLPRRNHRLTLALAVPIHSRPLVGRGTARPDCAPMPRRSKPVPPRFTHANAALPCALNLPEKRIPRAPLSRERPLRPDCIVRSERQRSLAGWCLVHAQPPSDASRPKRRAFHLAPATRQALGSPRPVALPTLSRVHPRWTSGFLPTATQAPLQGSQTRHIALHPPFSGSRLLPLLRSSPRHPSLGCRAGDLPLCRAGCSQISESLLPSYFAVLVELQCSAIACLFDADLPHTDLLMLGRRLQISSFFDHYLGTPNAEEIAWFERTFLTSPALSLIASAHPQFGNSSTP